MPDDRYRLPAVVDQFGLNIVDYYGEFVCIEAIPTISSVLTTLLGEQVFLAQAINTDKARSELIVINVLMEIRRHLRGEISIFSGVPLEVEKQEQFNGCCDFLISLGAQQAFVRAPLLAVMQARNSDLPATWGRCLIEMITMQRFNERHGNSIPKIYGVVTSGTSWMFGYLEGSEAKLDYQEYNIDEPERICGILIAMARQQVAGVAER